MKAILTQWILAFLVSSPIASLSTKPMDKEKNEPLIMENADHFEGYRSRGDYILTGHVRFSHGTLRIETERAVWQKERNIIYCESGMKITHRGAMLTADQGNYDKNQGQATADGHVFMRDSSGEIEARGKSIVYLRYQHLSTLAGDPELRRYYHEKDTTLPKNGAKKIKDAKTNASGPDTLIILGNVMTYNDSTQVAVTDGKTRISRDRLKITCKRAEYHDKADSLFLIGDPVMTVDDNQVKGMVMRLGMHGEDIKSLLVKGSAQAQSIEPATDTSVARNSDVLGDSLFLAFKEKNIDSVQVFRNATGTYFDADKPQFVNKMTGDYMVLRFVDKQIKSANVLGKAKSSYYHFEEKKLKGRNDAEGDAIHFAFKQGKIDEVKVEGNAKGTYFGEKQTKGETKSKPKVNDDSATTKLPSVSGGRK